MQSTSGVLTERFWKVQRASVHFLWPHFGARLSRLASLRLRRRRHHPAGKSECALVPAGQDIFWTFKRRAHIQSLILVHVGVGQRCCALDPESPAILQTMSTHVTFQRGAGWMKVQGQFKRRAHMGSFISVHVGVGQRCLPLDVKSPAMLPTMSTRNVPAGRWMKVQGMFEKVSTPTAQPDSRTRWCWSALPCPRCRAPRHAANHEHM